MATTLGAFGKVEMGADGKARIEVQPVPPPPAELLRHAPNAEFATPSALRSEGDRARFANEVVGLDEEEWKDVLRVTTIFSERCFGE
jgi:hypothetical protein